MNFSYQNTYNLRKFLFYCKAISEHLLIPDEFYRRRLHTFLRKTEQRDSSKIEDRVKYYIRIHTPFEVSPSAKRLKQLNPRKVGSLAYYDYRSVLRYFGPDIRLDTNFQDLRTSPSCPTIVKSRPIAGGDNSVLLKLKRARHFCPLKDSTPFSKKKNMLIFRGGVGHPNKRGEFFERHFDNPLCDLGQDNPTREGQDPRWLKPFTSAEKQLECKFILSLEGNDVATNLKWIAQSNSLCVMPKPQVETWFMEGRLQAGVHYAEVEDDYSNLDEVLNYYIDHTSEAETLIDNMQRFHRQFNDPLLEKLIEFNVVLSYLRLSGQFPGEGRNAG